MPNAALKQSAQVLEAILDDDQDMQDMYLARRAEMAEAIAPALDGSKPPPGAPLAFLPSISTSGRAESALAQALHNVAESEHSNQAGLIQSAAQQSNTHGQPSRQSMQEGASQQSEVQHSIGQRQHTGQMNVGQASVAQHHIAESVDTGQAESDRPCATEQGIADNQSTGHSGVNQASTGHLGFNQARTGHLGDGQASTGHLGVSQASTGHQGFSQAGTAQEQHQPRALQQAVKRLTGQWADMQHQASTSQQEEEAEDVEARITRHPLSMFTPHQVSPWDQIP